MLYSNIYLFFLLKSIFFKPSFWPSGQYFYLFPRARRVLESRCSIIPEQHAYVLLTSRQNVVKDIHYIQGGPSNTWNGYKKKLMNIFSKICFYKKDWTFPFKNETQHHFKWLTLRRLVEDEHFYRRIIFSGEAHFHIGGYFNKQNFRIWGSENPNVIIEKPMHPQRVIIWCGFCYGGIIGPFYFFFYFNVILIFGSRNWRGWHGRHLVPTGWGYLPHSQRNNRSFAHRFENRIISRNSDVNWLPQSYDFTPLAYFLWRAVKDKCCANHPGTTEALKHEIEIAIHWIEAQTIENVLRNWVDWMGYCKAIRGSNLTNVAFHS